MSTSRTFQMKMVRPDEEEMGYFWKLFYAAQRVEDRWGHGLAEISEELSYCPDMTREQKLFLLRAWQVLAADKGGFGRFMGAYDTYVHNMQDPADDCVAWKPSLIELFGNAELLPVVMEAYQEARQYIAELEARNKTVKPPREYTCYHGGPDGDDFRERCYLKDDVLSLLRSAGITLVVGGE